MKRNNKNSGFSLTEIMITALVIGICMSPIFYIFSRSNQGTMQTRDDVTAYTLAKEIVDYHLSLDFDDSGMAPVVAKKVNFETLHPTSGNDIVLTTDPRFDRFITIIDVSVSNIPLNYKVLVVEITWKSSGKARQFKMTSLKFKGS